MHLIKKMIHVC